MMEIYFDGKGTFVEWGLKLLDVKISIPDIKEKKIDIPGLDGELDLSASLTGDVQYHNRTVQYTFDASGSPESWSALTGRVANFLHGRQRRIIHGFDPGYYYEGRLSVDSTKSSQYTSRLVITGDVQPYKYEINDGSEDWEWDPFDLENGVIREYKNILVAGSRVVTVIGRRKRVIPSVTCSAKMALFFKGTTISLPAGTTRLYELQLGEGEHALTFVGNGTVTISYRGGSL